MVETGVMVAACMLWQCCAVKLHSYLIPQPVGVPSFASISDMWLADLHMCIIKNYTLYA